MYNLTVAGAHTFFVGSAQWLVHNCKILVGYHGTSSNNLESLKSGVRATDGEWGPGFYTTPDIETARLFAGDATIRATRNGIAAEPVIVEVYVEANILETLTGTQWSTSISGDPINDYDYLEGPIGGLPGHDQIKFNPKSLANLIIETLGG